MKIACLDNTCNNIYVAKKATAAMSDEYSETYYRQNVCLHKSIWYIVTSECQ